MDWQEEYKRKLISVEDAAAQIKSGDGVMMSAGPSTPVDVIAAISKRYKELKDVTIFSGLLMNPLDYLQTEYIGHIKHHTIFAGPLERMFLSQGI